MIVVDPENCGECPYFRQEDGQQYFVFCGREEGIEIKNINEIHPKCPFRKGRMDCWVVWVNEDLTEGRGAQKVLAVCEKEATARRLARGADTQGADGRVMELPVVLVYDLVKSKDFPVQNGPFFYGPMGVCQVRKPTKQDLFEEKRLEEERARRAKREEILQRACELGLSDEDIGVLRKG